MPVNKFAWARLHACSLRCLQGFRPLDFGWSVNQNTSGVMALVKCKGCGTRRVVGFMPTTTCGLLLLPGFGVAVAFGFAGFGYFQEVYVVGRIIIGLVAAILGFLLWVIAVHYIPWTLEWGIAMTRRCSECKRRSWSYPFTEGFGL